MYLKKIVFTLHFCQTDIIDNIVAFAVNTNIFLDEVCVAKNIFLSVFVIEHKFEQIIHICYVPAHV